MWIVPLYTQTQEVPTPGTTLVAKPAGTTSLIATKSSGRSTLVSTKQGSRTTLALTSLPNTDWITFDGETLTVNGANMYL